MARPLRLDHAGAVWHVTGRGNERREIFGDDGDREWFLTILGRVVKVYRWRVHAYVLMGNHYHLLIETPEATLSRGMRQLNGSYTQSFNRRHDRVGHLLQGRFKAILVEKEAHLLELARYVVLNPVRARMTASAGQWRWSSYRATAGLGPAPAWLETEWSLARFGPRSEAKRRYRAFVAQGKGSRYAPWEELVAQIYLGGEGFRKKAQAMVSAKTRSPRSLDSSGSLLGRALRTSSQRHRASSTSRALSFVEGATPLPVWPWPTWLATRAHSDCRNSRRLLESRIGPPLIWRLPPSGWHGRTAAFGEASAEFSFSSLNSQIHRPDPGSSSGVSHDFMHYRDSRPPRRGADPASGYVLSVGRPSDRRRR